MSGEQVSVHSCKYDGNVRRRWGRPIVRRSGTLIVIEGVFEAEVRHPLPRHDTQGTRSTSFSGRQKKSLVQLLPLPGARRRPRLFLLQRQHAGHTRSRRPLLRNLDIDVLVSTDIPTRFSTGRVESNAERYQYRRNFGGARGIAQRNTFSGRAQRIPFRAGAGVNCFNCRRYARAAQGYFD